MIRTLLTFALLVLLTTIFEGKDANAQARENCSIVYEEIIPLRNPNFNNLYLWRRVVGRTGYDWLNEYIELENKQAITLGLATEYINDDTAERFLTIKRYQNGYVIREQQLKIDGLQEIISAVRVKNDLFVGVNVKDDKGQNRAKLLKMGFDGENMRSISIVEEGHILTLLDMILDGDGHLVLSFELKSKKNPDDYVSVNYTYDTDFKKLRRRLYMPGTPNYLNGISVAQDGSLISAGSVRVESTRNGEPRNGGWLVNLDSKGSIYWQKSYARGHKAELVRASQYGENSYAAIGTAWPASKKDEMKPTALWILMVDANGTVIWQRFITGREQYSYSAVDMHVFEDGRMVVLANAKALKPSEKIRSHIRLITFTPQGTILQDQAFVEGADSKAHNLVMTSELQYRILGEVYTGYSALGTDAPKMDKKEKKEMSALEQIMETSINDQQEEAFRDPELTESVNTPTLRGWLLAVARPEDYNNPCR